MKVYSWNVNGIRAVQKKGFLDWVADEQPDILCLQETKAEESQLDDELRNIPGYHATFCSGERKGYSGTAIYSRIKPERIAYGMGIERFDNEGRILVHEYKNDFILYNIYFPNGQKDEERLQYKMDFYEALQVHLNELKAAGKKLLICGDVNTAHRPIDLKHPKSNEKRSGFLPVERAWIDRFLADGYVDTFRTLHPDAVEYSWWSYRMNARQKNVGWRIDYHYVSENLMPQVKQSYILGGVMGSDHCPIVVELDL